ncbi:aldehyde dehydrogenase [Aspergillus steynii IBT 23096]|uniref:Aldehyde dehydrogenase n=1 Tax=Aspergillus steynii IBT 23096 TaxID=1392250 RepID=A0A2I2FY75_9EURO|nr:aldehyde dehydrogenase [Aspergillus steynii IBT 23096]PLB45591.1 aldehyde dehydrogenase [Aspergillus steynii IBT 23096]
MSSTYVPPGSPVPLIINNKNIFTDTQFDVTNPGTGQVEHQCSSASAKDATDAVEAAQAAFPAWSRTKPDVRRDILLRTADVFVERKEEFLRYMVEETAAEQMYNEFIFQLGVNLLRDAAGKISSIVGTVPTIAGEGESAIIYKQPYGVILGIAPWNAPYILGTRSVALALAAGNTTVLKGSELSPKCFWAIGDAFRQAGLPDGALNVIYSRPQDAVEVTTALIAHPALRKLSFTGSTAVGRKIGVIAAQHIKPVILELGGKAPTIVLEDANLEKAALGAVLGSFIHSGQVCMCTERIIVHRSIVDQFRPVLNATIKHIAGGGSGEVVVINAAAVTKNRNLVRDAVSKGGKVIAGDVDAPTASDTRLAPIVVEGVTRDMDIYAEESFGPTVSLFVVDSDDEAVALANDTEYGLSAAVYTENLGRALKVAKGIDSGAVHINSMTVHNESVLPHGGVKNSGFGRFGSDMLDEFLWTKSVTWMD